MFSIFLFAFALAYALYPLLKFLQKHKIPKFLAILIILAFVIGIIAVLAILVAPLLFSQLTNLFGGIISFTKEISNKYNIDLGYLQDSLSTNFNQILVSLGKYVSDGAFQAIGTSLGYLSTILIAFSASMYFLSDMEDIRSGIKTYLLKKSKKMYRYVKLLDNEMQNYFTGFIRIILITGVEYSIAYTIIGHPNALLLGFLAMIANLIPYFGGIITNTIAAATAFVISPALFLRTVITFVVLSAVDGYIINPLIYGKTNKLHPLVVILSVFAGGIIFGIFGIIISLPLSIILISTYKYFKDDISDKIDDFRENNKNN